MVPFSLETPGAIHFGIGTIEKLSKIVKGLGNRVLIVSGTRWFSESPWQARFADALEGCTIQRLCCEATEPSVRSLDSAAETTSSFAPEVIVAVGGGSVLDTAKALSALLRYPAPVARYLEGMEGALPVPGPGIPWVAVPTTAGTGAETTKNAVLKSGALGLKRSMRSPFLLANAVIVDPQLTLTLPLSVTGASGLDALTQLVEAYVSRGTNAYVQSVIEGAFAPMLEALVKLPSNPKDPVLRSQACYGSLVSGIALANAGLGAAHGFAAAVGGLYGVPHGLACAVFLPPVLTANAGVIGGPLARLVGAAGGSEAAADPAAWLGEQVQKLLSAYGLPSNLRGFKIPSGSITDLAEKSSGTSMRSNPIELTREERIRILSSVIC
jgi:alcohol dehydrogenase class IV